MKNNQPIVMLSVFKSGTWLLRHIIQTLTGIPHHEPTIMPGYMDPENHNYLEIKPMHFYSWHLIPTENICQNLRALQARPIFLMRNIYDLAVSMYYHFSKNIDSELGRGANKHHYFSKISKDEGLMKIITGCNNNQFQWPGLGLHLHQIERMLAFSKEYSCHTLTYERLIENKNEEIENLRKFLHVTPDKNRLNDLIESSSFNTMKASAEKHNMGSHFRRGKIKSHTNELTEHHITAIRSSLLQHAPELPMLVKQTGFEEIIQFEL